MTVLYHYSIPEVVQFSLNVPKGAQVIGLRKEVTPFLEQYRLVTVVDPEEKSGERLDFQIVSNFQSVDLQAMDPVGSVWGDGFLFVNKTRTPVVEKEKTTT